MFIAALWCGATPIRQAAREPCSLNLAGNGTVERPASCGIMQFQLERLVDTTSGDPRPRCRVWIVAFPSFGVRLISHCGKVRPTRDGKTLRGSDFVAEKLTTPDLVVLGR